MDIANKVTVQNYG